MSTEMRQPERSPFARWVRATTVGWLIGFVLVVVLAMVWDMIGGRAQFMVGVGMGAGVGYMQARVVGAWVDPTRRWLWTSIIGTVFFVTAVVAMMVSAKPAGEVSFVVHADWVGWLALIAAGLSCYFQHETTKKADKAGAARASGGSGGAGAGGGGGSS